MYEVEYNGLLFEEVTEIGAIQSAKRLIAQDIGAVADWAVVHDQVINVWFVRAKADGEPIGATATITGPEQAVTNAAAEYPVHVPVVPSANRPVTEPGRRREGDLWLRCAIFVGASPAETFYDAYAWIAARQHAIAISNVGWSVVDASHQCCIKIYYHDHGR